MADVRHVFVSTGGDILPRWAEAFPLAIGCRFGERLVGTGPATLFWVRLPTADVAQALAGVRAVFGPNIACIALSDIPDDEEALACFAAAGRGYCNTHSVPVLLQRVAKVVSEGGLWIGESLMQRLLRGMAGIPPLVATAKPVSWAATLTEREREVARAVAAGASNKEIARQLGITERTVKAHVGALFDKLGVRDRLQLSLVVNGYRGI